MQNKSKRQRKYKNNFMWKSIESALSFKWFMGFGPWEY